MFDDRDKAKMVAGAAEKIFETGLDMAWSGVVQQEKQKSPLEPHPVGKMLQQGIMKVSGADRLMDEALGELKDAVADSALESLDSLFSK